MSNISNDSGLDDSANAAATRMSWFLAEVDEGSLKNAKPNGRTTLCVLHSMELLESDVSEKYMTRFVKFRMHNTVLEAKLVLAADERRLVDAALVAMSKERTEEADAKQILVQYTEDEGARLIQKLVPQGRVTWLEKALVKLGPGCIAHVLHSHDQRDHMEKALLHLKARCFDHAFDEQLDSAAPMDDDTWLLVQYSPEPEQVVYQVLKYSQTVWRQENLFQDVIAYVLLPGSEVVLQAVVISYGQQRAPLQAKYVELQRFSLNLDIPKPAELEQQLRQGSRTAALFARSTLFQRAEQRDASGEHKQLRRSLEQMGEKAQHEAQMIIEAFDMVDNINRNLQCRLGEVAASDAMH